MKIMASIDFEKCFAGTYNDRKHRVIRYLYYSAKYIQ